MPPAPGLARLPVLRNAEDLLEFLRERNWPLPFDALAEDLTFDWTGEDLRLPEAANQRLAGGSVRQLRTMAEGQPWGIFLVEFAKPHVYRTALRSVLRGLVPSRRRDSSLAAWQHPNLLFICATANYSQVTFAHFRGEKAGRARLATFGWEQGSRYARTLLEFNVPALAWPQRPSDTTGWLRQWSSAFDVEPVTKEFFRVYSDVFRRVEASVTGLAGDTEKRRMWTQRLFNRLMFIGFIEKKGWLRLGERTDYLAALWEAWQREPDKSGLSFYAARLKHLFFLVLNNAGERNLIGINRGGLFAHLLGDVPYLNGGLFEQDADDKDTSIGVPDEAIGTILNDLFARFNFTVTESTPLDVEVAVDPEMLGKVFEELVTGRHESGSYYTPKPIVAFMCREALKHYLAGALAEDPAALARFVDDHDPAGLREGERVLGALRRVRVCDPACGSGAYLLGMLHELVALRECLFATQRLDTLSSHTRKLEIIQHNLYGVDLDPFATNIARLRLWLSLAVEYSGDAPPPLPNLDFKIETGDSLSAPDPQIVFSGQGALRVTVAQQFHEAKAAYLLSHGEEKKALRVKVDALRVDLKTWLHSESPAGAFDWAVEFAEIFAPRPALSALDGGLNLGDTLAAVEPGGFDIIVANPPYVVVPPERRGWYQSRYESAEYKIDLYQIFIERGVKLLRPGGAFSYIIPSPWFTQKYSGNLRRYLLRETSIRQIVVFDKHVFSTADVHTAVLLLERNSPRPAIDREVSLRFPQSVNHLHDATVHAASQREWAATADGVFEVRLSDNAGLLAKRLITTGTPLGQITRVSLGCQAYNSSKHTQEQIKQRVFHADTKLGPDYMRELAGKDVGRYFIRPVRGKWIKYGSWLHDYRERDWLTGPRILVREIPDKAPYRIPAAYVEGEFCNYKTILNVNPSSQTPVSMKYLTAVLNSRVASFLYPFVASKLVAETFPRLSVADLRRIPMPLIDVRAGDGEQIHDALCVLNDRMMEAVENGNAATMESVNADIDAHVFRLYGLTPDEQALVTSTL